LTFEVEAGNKAVKRGGCCDPKTRKKGGTVGNRESGKGLWNDRHEQKKIENEDVVVELAGRAQGVSMATGKTRETTMFRCRC